jgi:hypothetical protein
MAIDAYTLEARDQERRIMDVKSVLIGVLSVAVVVLGYLLWDTNQTKVKIDLPGVKIEGR